MNLLTDVYELASSQPTLKAIDIDLKYCAMPIFDMGALQPDFIVSTNAHDCFKAAKRYFNTKFISPSVEFPAYKSEIYDGFDLISLHETQFMEISGDICFVNTKKLESKLFIKKLESIYADIKVFGEGFGISQIGQINLHQTGSLYKQFDIVAADCPSEIYKALYLGKKCITPFEFPYCYNIFSNSIPNLDNKQKEFALNNTFFDVFIEIFTNTGDNNLVEQLTKQKEIIIAKYN